MALSTWNLWRKNCCKSLEFGKKSVCCFGFCLVWSFNFHRCCNCVLRTPPVQMGMFFYVGNFTSDKTRGRHFAATLDWPCWYRKWFCCSTLETFLCLLEFGLWKRPMSLLLSKCWPVHKKVQEFFVPSFSFTLCFRSCLQNSWTELMRAWIKSTKTWKTRRKTSKAWKSAVVSVCFRGKSKTVFVFVKIELFWFSDKAGKQLSGVKYLSSRCPLKSSHACCPRLVFSRVSKTFKTRSTTHLLRILFRFAKILAGNKKCTGKSFSSLHSFKVYGDQVLQPNRSREQCCWDHWVCSRIEKEAFVAEGTSGQSSGTIADVDGCKR